VASVLVVVAGLPLVIGVLTLYASINVFHPGRFADRATSVLDEPEVREVLAARVVRGIVKAEPDLIGAQPLLETATEAIAGSRPFHQLVRGAVADLHRTFFGREKDTVALTLADVGVLVSEAVRSFAPDVAKRIPADVEPTLTSLGEDQTGILADGAQLAEDVEWAAVLSLILTAALVGAAFYMSPDRRRTAGQAAVCVAIAGAVGVLAFEAGRLIVAGRFADPGDRAAARAVWSALFLDLRTWSVVLAVAGVVVAAAARSLIRPVAATDLLERGWARVSAPPASTAGRVGRAAGLTVAGVVFVAAPGRVLVVAVVAAGVVLLYGGVVEFLRVALPPEAVPAEERRRLPRPGRRFGVAALAAVAVVGLALVVALVTNRAEEPPFELRTCNGSAALCDRTIAQVVFPSTHNSMSAADRPKWLFAQQEAGVGDQLEAGIRGLLIDTHYGVDTDKGVYTLLERGSASRLKLGGPLGDRFVQTAERLRSRIGYRGGGRREVYLCHGFCELGSIEAPEALASIREFLVKHPSEVVVLSVENDIELEGTARVFEESGLSDMAWDRPVGGGNVPTLRQMIEADRRVLVLVWQRGPLGKARFDEYPWMHPQFEVVQETPYSFKSVDELMASESCRPNEGSPANPLFLLNHWVDTSPYFLPRNARKVNAFGPLLERARRCMRARRRLPNLVAVDFFEEGDVLGVARALNEAGPGAVERASPRPAPAQGR
jgi:hypothetical protein